MRDISLLFKGYACASAESFIFLRAENSLLRLRVKPRMEGYARVGPASIGVARARSIRGPSVIARAKRCNIATQ